MTKHAGQPSLTRRFVIALATPVFLLLGVGSILALQVARMRTDAEWVDHSDAVAAKTFEVQTAIVDQETGLRGFLLSGDRTFLEPYQRAHPLDAIATLRVLVAGDAGQSSRVDELRRRYEEWQRSSLEAMEGGLAGARELRGLAARKERMDAVRAAIDDIRGVEITLRNHRAAVAATSARNTMYIGAGLMLALAAVLALSSRRHLLEVARMFQEALGAEAEQRARLEREEWVQRGQVELATALQGDRSVTSVAELAIDKLATYAGAQVGAFYVAITGGWERAASHALGDDDARARFKEGEGLVGQAAKDGALRTVTDVPPGYAAIRSGTGASDPRALMLLPAASGGVVEGVVELGFLTTDNAHVQRLLERVGENIAVAIRSARYRMRLKELLEQSQQQAEELQTQQEELRVTNEELQSQSDALRLAHAQLEERKEELEVSNASLAEQRDALAVVRADLEEKAIEVERASRYKSEFLANMSHELRTPLNSTLILAKLLADNREGNLTAEQVKFASTIYTAGNDLLALINDVLDLSKVEAGKMEVRVTKTTAARVAQAAARVVEPMAREKGLTLTTDLAGGDVELATDAAKLQQVLKNLLANAVKFTEHGEVRLVVRGEEGPSRVSFAVVDTGIGIAPEHMSAIFEKFRQAESTSNRRFGGTGLGLSISRDLARLLGGDVHVESELGRGSTFTVTVPRVYPAPNSAAAIDPAAVRRPAANVRLPSTPPSSRARRSPTGPVSADAKTARAKSDRLVLIVEDDEAFAGILVDLARELDFRALVAHTADAGVRLALEHLPSAVLLDMNLPDHSGLSVLDRLKRDPSTRHIPVHVVSGEDRSREALSMGAAGYLVKPTSREALVEAFKKLESRLSRRVRRILVVDDDAMLRDSTSDLLDSLGVETVGVGTVHEALDALRASTFDCVVTDLTLPDASGFDLLETMARDEAFSFPPVIVYTGRVLSDDEEQRLRRYSSSIIVKGARSPERLLDEITLFLHQVESELPADRQRMLQNARDREALFEGRRILIVEDDVRNVFALTSVLEPKGAEVLIARNGREALEALERVEKAEQKIDVVLMDLMMPEMDGLAATRAIRQRPRWAKLPVIALTAKAMKDDQERFLEAGANDYIRKPLDVAMLLSLLRVWMPK